MTPSRQLLLDIGGTFIKCSDARTIPVDSNGTREEIVKSFRVALGDMSTLESVAIAIPGPFDYANGVFLMKHKFAALYGESFAELVQAPKGLKMSFIHDVNVMLRGEMTSGEAIGYKNAALVALGTGLGFSHSVDGQIRCNQLGSPEISIYYWPYKDGILEDFVSKRGLLRLYSELSGKTVEDMTVKQIAVLASGGDKAARDCFDMAGQILAQTIEPILRERNIQCLLFGGQICKSFEYMESAVREGLKELSCLVKISKISDFDNATFKGLKSL